MKFLNIFEKLQIVFDLIVNSNTLVLLTFFIIAAFILRLNNKINNRKMGILIFLIEVLAFGTILYFNNDTLVKTGNDLIDNIFLNFYFPSIYGYLFIFVFTFVVFIYNLFNRFISKTYKVITNIYFLLFNFIFVLFINVVAKNNINIFAKESLFTNNESLVLLELSTLLFFIYLVINVIIYFTNCAILFVESKRFAINKNIDKEKLILENVNIEVDYDNNNNEDTVKELIPETVSSFNELVIKTNELNIQLEEEKVVKPKIDLVPEFTQFVKNNVSNSDNNFVSEVNDGFKFIDPTLFGNRNNIIKINDNKVQGKLNFIDFNVIDKGNNDKLTLNDYKMFSQMLKTVIENNKTPNLGITDILNKNLLNKYSEEEYNKFEKILNSCMN